MFFEGKKKIHFIAIGGAIMHNLAICLSEQGHDVTGSDDIIYDPSLSRLKAANLAPEQFGWFPENISNDIDFVVLGKHARIDNPELKKAQDLGVKIHSFPSLISILAKDKLKIVVAGSHGKTTTSSMIMHCLNYHKISHDYLVGAQLEGYRNMVQISDADIMVIEGDEYLSSALDNKPKFSHYHPDILVITGIEWDHINVFKTLGDYINQFYTLVSESKDQTEIFIDENDRELQLMKSKFLDKKIMSYSPFQWQNDKIHFSGKDYPVEVFGTHNMSNMKAAFNVCQALGIDTIGFLGSMRSFKGAAKRQQLIYETKKFSLYWDFAHAPSKVRATVKAFSHKFQNQDLAVIVELHTYSSLDRAFIPMYKDSVSTVDEAIVYYDKENLAIKKMEPLDPDFIKGGFNNEKIRVCEDKDSLKQELSLLFREFEGVVLIMSSGQLGGLNLLKLAKRES